MANRQFEGNSWTPPKGELFSAEPDGARDELRRRKAQRA